LVTDHHFFWRQGEPSVTKQLALIEGIEQPDVNDVGCFGKQWWWCCVQFKTHLETLLALCLLKETLFFLVLRISFYQIEMLLPMMIVSGRPARGGGGGGGGAQVGGCQTRVSEIYGTQPNAISSRAGELKAHEYRVPGEAEAEGRASSVGRVFHAKQFRQ
jgi:hypothetical protein